MSMSLKSKEPLGNNNEFVSEEDKTLRQINIRIKLLYDAKKLVNIIKQLSNINLDDSTIIDKLWEEAKAKL